MDGDALSREEQVIRQFSAAAAGGSAKRSAPAGAALRSSAPANSEIPPALQSIDFPEYIGSFEVADYIVDPIIQAGRVYSLTALTGHGKTAVMTTAVMSLACDR